MNLSKTIMRCKMSDIGYREVASRPTVEFCMGMRTGLMFLTYSHISTPTEGRGREKELCIEAQSGYKTLNSLHMLDCLHRGLVHLCLFLKVDLDRGPGLEQIISTDRAIVRDTWPLSKEYCSKSVNHSAWLAIFGTRLSWHMLDGSLLDICALLG